MAWELVEVDDVVLDAQGAADQVAHEAGLDGHPGVLPAATCVPVQTPQMRSTKAHTSRRSRQAITSMPRYCTRVNDHLPAGGFRNVR